MQRPGPGATVERQRWRRQECRKAGVCEVSIIILSYLVTGVAVTDHAQKVQLIAKGGCVGLQQSCIIIEGVCSALYHWVDD